MGDQTVLRVGVLGAAVIAKKNVRAISLAASPIEVVAVASRNIERAEKFITELCLPGKVTAYGCYDDLLADESVDALYIPVPSGLHLEWVVKAAQKGKHVLCEKPIALNVPDTDVILRTCEEAGIQFMDGTMWLHNPRTALIKERITDASFGILKTVISSFTFYGDAEFLAKDVRTKKDLDGLGCLGDLGWYCVGFPLWVFSYQLPYAAYAHPGAAVNEEGVLINFGGTLLWKDGRKAQIYCSFDRAQAQYAEIASEKQTLHLDDFVIPFQEESCSFFTAGVSGETDANTRFDASATEVKAFLDRPQETFMWEAFAECVRAIRGGGKPIKRWLEAARATQIVVSALADSHAKGCGEVLIEA